MFLREDIAMLSIYETFTINEDIPDFLENLKFIFNNPSKRAKFVHYLIYLLFSYLSS